MPQLARDPELSILLALEAVGLAATDSSTEALRKALLESRAQRVVDVDEPLWSQDTWTGVLA